MGWDFGIWDLEFFLSYLFFESMLVSYFDLQKL